MEHCRNKWQKRKNCRYRSWGGRVHMKSIEIIYIHTRHLTTWHYDPLNTQKNGSHTGQESHDMACICMTNQITNTTNSTANYYLMPCHLISCGSKGGQGGSSPLWGAKEGGSEGRTRRRERRWEKRMKKAHRLDSERQSGRSGGEGDDKEELDLHPQLHGHATHRPLRPARSTWLAM